MSGCLDRVSCSCDWLEPVKEWIQPKRNMFASILSGTLVSVLYTSLCDHINLGLIIEIFGLLYIIKQSIDWPRYVIATHTHTHTHSVTH